MKKKISDEDVGNNWRMKHVEQKCPQNSDTVGLGLANWADSSAADMEKFKRNVATGDNRILTKMYLD